MSTAEKLTGQGVSEDVGRILPIAICFGVSILLAMAYSIGHITGGHMNPGVSLLMFFRGQLSLTKMMCYWFAQLVGAMLASALVWGSVSGMEGIVKAGGNPVLRTPFYLGSTTLNEDVSTGNGFLLEFMGSFIFYFVIAQTALDKRGVAKTSFPAIPIGLILVVVHVCLIPFTGCGVNPARTFGPAMVTCMGMGSEHCSNVVGSWWWIYWVGPFAAAFCVAEVTHLMDMDVGDDEPAGEEKVVSGKQVDELGDSESA